MSEELKLCPFCGSGAVFHNQGSGWGLVTCGAGKHNCPANPHIYDRQEAAITAWNTRASHPQGDVSGLVAALEPLAANGAFYKPEVPHFESVPVPLDLLRAALTTFRRVVGREPSIHPRDPNEGKAS